MGVRNGRSATKSGRWKCHSTSPDISRVKIDGGLLYKAAARRRDWWEMLASPSSVCPPPPPLSLTDRQPHRSYHRKRRVVGKVHCRNIKHECPKPSCDEPVLAPDRCCKVCPGDVNTLITGRSIEARRRRQVCVAPALDCPRRTAPAQCQCALSLVRQANLTTSGDGECDTIGSLPDPPLPPPIQDGNNRDLEQSEVSTQSEM
ncbi:hypothetical protein J6590_061553 [Homalodisca vitripennis]|nr:hypothetical protein J6590_061553 [Homalodisca vitripennis]